MAKQQRKRSQIRRGASLSRDEKAAVARLFSDPVFLDDLIDLISPATKEKIRNVIRDRPTSRDS